MLLPTAIILACSICFSQQLHLHKREIENPVPAIQNGNGNVSVEQNASRSRRDNISSEAVSAGEQAVQAERKSVIADIVSENSFDNVNSVSETSAIKVDVVTEKFVANSEAESQKPLVNEVAILGKSAVKADAISGVPSIDNVDNVSEKSGSDTINVSEKVDQASLVELDSNQPVNFRRNSRESNRWCRDLKKCQPNNIEVCGYDEKAGFAKFTNYCHLMQVNCYWNHDFTLHACKAMQLKKMGRPVFNK